MDLDAFVTEHGGEWRRLDQLAGRRRLNATEVDELIALYQRAGTHLSAVRSRAPDPALIAQLSRLVLTARATVTGGKAFSWRTVGLFLTETFPLVVFQAWRWWCGVATIFTALSFAFMAYVASSYDVQLKFLPPDQIDSLIHHDFRDYYSQGQAQNFGLEVWTNNALLTGLALASGVLIVPVIYLLYNNLVNIGVVGGVMIGHGRAAEFFGLITPHGLLELTAVFIGSGVGLRIGWAWIAPGPLRSRGQALSETARAAMLVALGLVLVLGVSGLLEAFVTPSLLPTAIRVGTGVVVWLAFLGYVIVLGARASRLSRSADLDETINVAAVPVV